MQQCAMERAKAILEVVKSQNSAEQANAQLAHDNAAEAIRSGQGGAGFLAELHMTEMALAGLVEAEVSTAADPGLEAPMTAPASSVAVSSPEISAFIDRYFAGIPPAAGTTVELRYASGSRADQVRTTTISSINVGKKGSYMQCVEDSGNRTCQLRLVQAIKVVQMEAPVAVPEAVEPPAEVSETVEPRTAVPEAVEPPAAVPEAVEPPTAVPEAAEPLVEAIELLEPLHSYGSKSKIEMHSELRQAAVRMMATSLPPHLLQNSCKLALVGVRVIPGPLQTVYKKLCALIHPDHNADSRLRRRHFSASKLCGMKFQAPLLGM